MKHSIKLLLISILFTSILTGCSAGDLAKKREQQAGKGDSIVIGVPVPLEFADKNTKFLKGLELAREDINSQGVNGKKIELKIVDDKGIFKDAVDLAQEFSADSGMLAVIGHWFSNVCIPVSSIYEKAGMLTIVPTVSNPELMGKGYKFIFQNIPSDKRIAEEMCDHARDQGYKKVVVYYEESSYGKNLADALENAAKERGLTIVDRSSGLISELQFKRAYDKWRALDFDAVLLGLNMPEGANFISQIKKIERRTTIISADGLDVGNLIEILGADAEGIVVATNYSPDKHSPQLEKFTTKYLQKYNEQPDVWAIQGYDSLKLIANAIEQANSYSPTEIANYLHKMSPTETVSGNISFNEYGEVQGREIYKKVVVGGKFKYLD